MIFSFNQFTLDTGQYRLSSADGEVSVEPLVFDLLAYFVENRERVVGRDELLKNLWAGKVVSDSALGARLKDVRKAVQDSGSKQQVIKTLHGRGYQFIADVSVVPDSSIQQSDTDTAKPTNYAMASTKASIAVLPFTNLRNDQDQEYFSDGITEDIITALSHDRGHRAKHLISL